MGLRDTPGDCFLDVAALLTSQPRSASATEQEAFCYSLASFRHDGPGKPTRALYDCQKSQLALIPKVRPIEYSS